MYRNVLTTWFHYIDYVVYTNDTEFSIIMIEYKKQQF